MLQVFDTFRKLTIRAYFKNEIEFEYTFYKGVFFCVSRRKGVKTHSRKKTKNNFPTH